MCSGLPLSLAETFSMLCYYLRLFLPNSPFFSFSFHRCQTSIAICSRVLPLPLTCTCISSNKCLAGLILSWCLLLEVSALAQYLFLAPELCPCLLSLAFEAVFSPTHLGLTIFVAHLLSGCLLSSSSRRSEVHIDW